MLSPIVASFDDKLLSESFLTNPYPVFDELRSKEPVYWSDAWNCWVLTSYEHVSATFKDPTRYLNSNRFDTIFEVLPDDVVEEVKVLQRHFQTGLINSDPPDHTRVRNLVHKAFTPTVIRKMQSNVQNMVDRYLDRVQQKGHMDVIRDLAFPLPVIVIATILGVPKEDHEKFKHWSDEVIAFQATGRTTPEVVRKSHKALVEMRQYLRNIFEQRRREPQDDLISALLMAKEQDDMLNEEELLSTCVTMMIAGHETTTNLIGNSIYILLTHPELREELKENPSLMPGAIEEFLRFESPLQRNRKIAASDMEFGGKRIKKGQLFLQMLGAANRDPAQFDKPDEVNIRRNPNPHIAFGLGIHFCLGAPLARMEAPIAINTMLRRMPDMRLDNSQPIRWHTELSLIRGLKELIVSF